MQSIFQTPACVAEEIVHDCFGAVAVPVGYCIEHFPVKRDRSRVVSRILVGQPDRNKNAEKIMPSIAARKSLCAALMIDR